MARHPAGRSRGTRYFNAPAWLGSALIAEGRARPENRRGLLHARSRQGHPRPRSRQAGFPRVRVARKPNPEVVEILKIEEPGREVRQAARPARIRRRSSCGRCFRDLFHYSRLPPALDIADTARDVDFAMRWGYGWNLGPFETWQAAGWTAGRRSGSPRTSPLARPWAAAPLPAWVTDGRAGVHGKDGSFSPAQNARPCPARRTGRSTGRQRFPETVIGERLGQPRRRRCIETDAVRLWHRRRRRRGAERSRPR